MLKPLVRKRLALTALSGVAFLFLPTLSLAQDSAGPTVPLTTPAAASADKTGTNPLNLQTEARLFNDYQRKPRGKYFNVTTAQYVMPFLEGKAAVRFRIPLVASDLDGKSRFGLGDLNFRANYVPVATPKYGILVGLEASLNTASKETLGAGKNLLAPVFVYAMFLPGGQIFAPAYQQFFTLSGDRDRAGVNNGAFDFYYVKSIPKGWWIVDPAVTLNYAQNTHIGGQVELERGFVLGAAGKGVASWYLRPGVGFTKYRAYDWSLEVGYKIVGL